MKMITNLVFTLFMMVPAAWSMDEKDIPPPPMPEYMKKHHVKMETQNTALPEPEVQSSDEEPATDEEMTETVERETASEAPSSFAEESADSIKEEFLQAGEDDLEVADPEAVQDALQGDIAETPTQETPEAVKQVLEDPVNTPPVEEVSEVEVAEPEFEQVTIDPEETELEAGEPTDPEDPEVLARVEESLEESEQEAEATLAGGRQPSGENPFKSGMYQFKKECTLYAEPGTLSAEAGKVPVGRKLWLDPHDGDWLKAYKKSVTVYLSTDCLR